MNYLKDPRTYAQLARGDKLPVPPSRFVLPCHADVPTRKFNIRDQTWVSLEEARTSKPRGKRTVKLNNVPSTSSNDIQCLADHVLKPLKNLNNGGKVVLLPKSLDKEVASAPVVKSQQAEVKHAVQKSSDPIHVMETPSIISKPSSDLETKSKRSRKRSSGKNTNICEESAEKKTLLDISKPKDDHETKSKHSRLSTKKRDHESKQRAESSNNDTKKSRSHTLKSKLVSIEKQDKAKKPKHDEKKSIKKGDNSRLHQDDKREVSTNIQSTLNDFFKAAENSSTVKVSTDSHTLKHPTCSPSSPKPQDQTAKLLECDPTYNISTPIMKHKIDLDMLRRDLASDSDSSVQTEILPTFSDDDNTISHKKEYKLPMIQKERCETSEVTTEDRFPNDSCGRNRKNRSHSIDTRTRRSESPKRRTNSRSSSSRGSSRSASSLSDRSDISKSSSKSKSSSFSQSSSRSTSSKNSGSSSSGSSRSGSSCSDSSDSSDSDSGDNSQSSTSSTDKDNEHNKVSRDINQEGKMNYSYNTMNHSHNMNLTLNDSLKASLIEKNISLNKYLIVKNNNIFYSCDYSDISSAEEETSLTSHLNIEHVMISSKKNTFENLFKLSPIGEETKTVITPQYAEAVSPRAVVIASTSTQDNHQPREMNDTHQVGRGKPLQSMFKFN